MTPRIDLDGLERNPVAEILECVAAHRVSMLTAAQLLDPENKRIGIADVVAAIDVRRTVPNVLHLDGSYDYYGHCAAALRSLLDAKGFV